VSVCDSDRMVWPSLFQDRISNLTNLFRPEPNRTEPDRIFAFVNLLFGNLEVENATVHTYIDRSATYLQDIRSYSSVYTTCKVNIDRYNL